jgi:hypothetical protein
LLTTKTPAFAIRCAPDQQEQIDEIEVQEQLADHHQSAAR